MIRILSQWLLSALALLAVSALVEGFEVQGLGAALAAALVIGLLNATVGAVLKLITLPLTLLTLGLFLLVINAVMLLLASAFVRGFHVRGLGAAFWGAVILAIINLVFRQITK